MGKGLSNLQKFILVKSVENESQKNRDVDGFKRLYGIIIEGNDIYAPEVMYYYYNFPLRRNIPGPGTLRHSWQHFSMNEIGTSKYKSAQASVSKAFSRLEERGFLVRWYYEKKFMAARLTDKGREKGMELKESGITSISLIPNSDT
jgi:hypothetical protein